MTCVGLYFIQIKKGGFLHEKRIQNVLMDIDGVENAKASHIDKNVKITLNKDVDINILKEAIEDLDFKVVDL